jgi:hypothetical protein
MSLYVVKHQHSAEVCPAGDPQIGPMLSQHVSSTNAEQHGLNLHGEAVIDGGHTLYLIVDAPQKETVDRFMAPFSQMGSVEVMPASSCEAVVSRAHC